MGGRVRGVGGRAWGRALVKGRGILGCGGQGGGGGTHPARGSSPPLPPSHTHPPTPRAGAGLSLHRPGRPLPPEHQVQRSHATHQGERGGERGGEGGEGWGGGGGGAGAARRRHPTRPPRTAAHPAPPPHTRARARLSRCRCRPWTTASACRRTWTRWVLLCGCVWLDVCVRVCVWMLHCCIAPSPFSPPTHPPTPSPPPHTRRTASMRSRPRSCAS